MPFRIADLNAFFGAPDGTQLAEISNGGAGSFKIPIAVLSAGRQANNVIVGGVFTVTATTYGDVLVNTNSAVTVQLPVATGRNGVPVSVIGISSAPAITILPGGSDTILGLSSITIANQYGAFTLWPMTGGWYQK